MRVVAADDEVLAADGVHRPHDSLLVRLDRHDAAAGDELARRLLAARALRLDLVDPVQRVHDPRQPGAARLEERHAQVRELLEHPAEREARHRHHVLERESQVVADVQPPQPLPPQRVVRRDVVVHLALERVAVHVERNVQLGDRLPERVELDAVPVLAAPVAVDGQRLQPQLLDRTPGLYDARLHRLRPERHDARPDQLVGVLLLRVRGRVVVAHAERKPQPGVPLALVRRAERVGVDAVRDEHLHLESGLRQQLHPLVRHAVADWPALLARRRRRGVDGARALPRRRRPESPAPRLAVGEEQRVTQQHIQRLLGDADRLAHAGEVRRREEVAVAVYPARSTAHIRLLGCCVDHRCSSACRCTVPILLRPSMRSARARCPAGVLTPPW